MSLLKIAMGAAAGVGVLVAIPVFGPIGAISAAGAVVGGGVGAIFGGVVAAMDAEERERYFQKGFEEGQQELKAEFGTKYELLERKIASLRNQNKRQGKLEEFTRAMIMIGFGAAWADGELAPEEISAIEEYLGGLAFNQMSWLKPLCEKASQTPVLFDAVIKAVEALDESHHTMIRGYVSIIVEATGSVSKQEREFAGALRAFMEKREEGCQQKEEEAARESVFIVSTSRS